MAGCKGIASKGEKDARQQVQAVSDGYRPNGQKPALPVLSSQSSLSNYLTYALLNDPRVEASYFDWLASVEAITVARSLPDPQVTFQMDIQDVVTSLMPGVMMSFPGLGKLRAAGALAAAESQAKYYAFKSASLQSAYAVEVAYYQLYFLQEKIRVNRETLALLSDLARLARVQEEVGRVTLQDVLRAQIEERRVQTDLANLEDSREPLLAQFKAALGLRADQPAPPVPQRLESVPLDLTSDQVLAAALARNTRLQGLEAEVRSAEASITLAYKARMPDVTVGAMADLKTTPTLYRPWGTVSLPLWRDKLAAEVAQAQANARAGEARLTAEQIDLAVAVAEKAFLYRQAGRNTELLQTQLIPRQRQSLEVARAGYLSGQIDFFNLTDVEQTLLRFSLDEVEARAQREQALAELVLIAEGLPAAAAPMGGPAMAQTVSVGGMGPSAGEMLPGNSAGSAMRK
ncbi:MAG TPA: TolC family protein [Candidatus Acidoferrum sp.]|nr:TolC family protein [Candidatus Acidoferrum sp.]